MKSELNHIIKLLLGYEESLDARLDLLTEIGLTTTNNDIFNATEEIRHELASGSKMEKGSSDDLRDCK